MCYEIKTLFGSCLLFALYFCLVLLLIDNYDSFTYNLCDYFLQCGVEVEVVRNDEIEVDTILERYSGIIISPGPGEPYGAGSTMNILEKYADCLPIFGVCLGMQAIGLHFGARISRAPEPMHGKVSELIINQKHKMFMSVLEPLMVCRYHSLILSNVEQTNLEVLAKTDSGEVMALAHRTLPIWAVQFHPEAILTSQGLLLIDNWLVTFNLQNTKQV